jgi:chorismate dehydratase
MSRASTGSVPLRVGCVRYLNALPFAHALESALGESGLEIILERAAPADLNRSIREGRIDVGVISSLEYARFAERYLILPGFCIGAGTFSESVILASRVPLRDLEGRTVALSRESLSSQVLLKILLNKMRIRCLFRETPQDPERMLAGSDACLLIGDGALFSPLGSGLRRYDLAHLWQDLTGLPFCFALWAARRRFAEEHGELVRGFHRLLGRRLAENLKDQPSFLAAWLGSENVPGAEAPLGRLERCFRYLAGLQFEMTSALERGLLRYFEFAREIGELERVPRLEYFGDNGNEPAFRRRPAQGF